MKNRRKIYKGKEKNRLDRIKEEARFLKLLNGHRPFFLTAMSPGGKETISACLLCLRLIHKALSF